MTANEYPGGPIFVPRSTSGVVQGEDRAVPCWGPDTPGPEAGPRTGGAGALFDAAFSDEAVRRRRAWARAAAAQRLEEVRTSKAAREAWLASFPQEWRAEMDRRLVAEYGQIGASA